MATDQPLTESKKKKRSGGAWCSAVNCTNNSQRNQNLSFFSFPKEPKRCKSWIIRCRRRDLLKRDTEYVHKNCRLCRDHFEPIMFLNDLRNRLHAHAEPSLFNVANPPPTITSKRKLVIRQPYESILRTKRKRTYKNITTTNPTEPSEMTATEEQHQLQKQLVEEEPVDKITATTQTSPIGDDVEYVTVSVQTPAASSSSTRRSPHLKTKIDFDALLENCHGVQGLPPYFLDYVKSQIELSTNDEQGKRSSIGVLKFSLFLYFFSPKEYRFVRQFFSLPTKRKLSNYLCRLSIGTGLQNIAISAINTNLSKIPANQRICILCIDEMSLKSHLFYNAQSDTIVGFDCFADGVNDNKPATSALVIMARGLTRNWMQPIAYTFINGSCKRHDVEKLTKKCITELSNVGVRVAAVVTNHDSNFIQLSQKLGVTTESPFFVHNDQKIFYLFDMPDLLKSVRDALMKHDFVFNGKEASWEDIVSFYSSDIKRNLRLAPKLEPCHIEPDDLAKANVRYAAQVLSHTVAACIDLHATYGVLPSKATGTAKFVKMFNDMFDFMNASRLVDDNPLKCGFDGNNTRVAFVNNCIAFVKSLKAIESNNLDCTSQLKFLASLQITLKATLGVWDYVKSSNFKVLLTGRLNRDPLERFFSLVRKEGQNSDNPTPVQFERAFKKLFLTENILLPGKGNAAEHETKLTSFVNEIYEVVSEQLRCVNEPLTAVKCCDFKGEITERNALSNISCYLLRKCLRKHSCDDCRLFSHEGSNLHAFFRTFGYESERDADDYGGLLLPSERFMLYVENLECVFDEMFHLKKIPHRGIGSSMYAQCDSLPFPVTCPNFPKKYLIALFLRLRIFYSLRVRNRRLTETNNEK